ncbi:MAG: DMT family transporter [bacterium]|nr:DMT family transporter [bacterium]MDE0352970.1 DMT family transporter [bacterium]
MTIRTATLLPARARGILLLAAAGTLWSTLGLGVRIMDTATTWQILFYRAIAQVVVIGAWVAMRRGRGFARSFADIGADGVIAGASISMASIAFVYALSLTTVAEAVFLFSMAPVLAGLLGWVVLREPITRITWLAMVLVLAGIAVMNGPAGSAGVSMGTFLALLSALGFALFTVLQRRRRHVDMLPAIAVSGLITAAATVWLIGGTAPSSRDLAVAFWLGGISLAGGLALYTVGARHVRPAESVLISMIEIVLAPLWVWWLFDETAGVAILAGGAIVLAGVLIQALGRDSKSRRRGQREPPSDPPRPTHPRRPRRRPEPVAPPRPQ